MVHPEHAARPPGRGRRGNGACTSSVSARPRLPSGRITFLTLNSCAIERLLRHWWDGVIGDIPLVLPRLLPRRFAGTTPMVGCPRIDAVDHGGSCSARSTASLPCPYVDLRVFRAFPMRRWGVPAHPLKTFHFSVSFGMKPSSAAPAAPASHGASNCEGDSAARPGDWSHRWGAAFSGGGAASSKRPAQVRSRNAANGLARSFRLLPTLFCRPRRRSSPVPVARVGQAGEGLPLPVADRPVPVVSP